MSGASLNAVAPAVMGNDLGVMQEAVQVVRRWARHRGVCPFLRAVAGHDGGAFFGTAHDDFEQILAECLAVV